LNGGFARGKAAQKQPWKSDRKGMIMGNWWLSYGIYKSLEAEDKRRHAMAELEAQLAAQDTPKQAAERQSKEIRAAIIAAVIALPLVFWFDWKHGDGNIFRLMALFFAWYCPFRIFLPPSRARIAIDEHERQVAQQEAARNEAVRQEKIGRGLETAAIVIGSACTPRTRRDNRRFLGRSLPGSDSQKSTIHLYLT
jgi:hypothetical protein